jgi:response regulator RpfG family c-di-GMP phosphodiesterase
MQRPLRFILIDDEVCSNKISEAFLKRLYPNAEIADFLSPLHAIQYIDNEYKKYPVPTAILLDINMPELNGWQVLEKLQESPLQLKEYLTVFMLSSSIDPKDKQKAEEHPLIKGYIEKPLSRDILISIFGE